MNLRVVLIDDDLPSLVGMEAMLTAAGIEVVAKARDGWTGVAAVREHRPDVVLLDLVMPGCDGLAALLLLRRLGIGSPSIVLTKHDEDDRLLSAMTAGTQGFLRKDVDAEEIVTAILAVHAGHGVLSRTTFERLGQLAAAGATQVVHRMPLRMKGYASLATLTGRELEVLELVVAGRSNQEIARQLNISLATVKSHVSSVLNKLQLQRRAQVVALFAT